MSRGLSGLVAEPHVHSNCNRSKLQLALHCELTDFLAQRKDDIKTQMQGPCGSFINDATAASLYMTIYARP